MASENRIQSCIDAAREMLTEPKYAGVEEDEGRLALTETEWQSASALIKRAVERGLLTAEEQTTATNVLGTEYSSANGGWAEGAGFAEKAGLEAALTVLAQRALLSMVAAMVAKTAQSGYDDLSSRY